MRYQLDPSWLSLKAAKNLAEGGDTGPSKFSCAYCSGHEQVEGLGLTPTYCPNSSLLAGVHRTVACSLQAVWIYAIQAFESQQRAA